MKRWLWTLIAVGGCTSATQDGYAPDTLYHREIAACVASATCVPLCMKVFGASLDEIDSCRITAIDAGGAHVRVVFAGGGWFDLGDWDDGDDGDDDTTDDGAGSGSDDGSGAGSDLGTTS